MSTQTPSYGFHADGGEELPFTLKMTYTSGSPELRYERRSGMRVCDALSAVSDPPFPRVTETTLPLLAIPRRQRPKGMPPTLSGLCPAKHREYAEARANEINRSGPGTTRREFEQGLSGQPVAAEPGWHERKREQKLHREWERWRDQRSKVPAEKRGRMMKSGQRSCKHCQRFFAPASLRQRYCEPNCRTRASRTRAAA